MVLEYDINRMVALSAANQYDDKYYSYLTQRVQHTNTLLSGVIVLLLINMVWTYIGVIKNMILLAIGGLVSYCVVYYLTTQSFLTDKSSINFDYRRWKFEPPKPPPVPVEYSIV
jgi:hypothetical protein